ncbi:MAG TPA: acyltransferase domain-containing protein [Methylomusa anaerophila]|nr:acyltransferase domain-containing protein [Methylomusa anaerophila]HML90581.1 acyltransferase domain-containing protein [Methylomusa anaerophila]
MFSGQGSQYYHMGKALYSQNTVFRHWLSKLNDIVYNSAGISIIDEIYNQAKSKGDRFDNLIYTHPAIFMVEYSLVQVLIEQGIKPDYVLGASLGEFTAAAIAGVLSLEETLDCILKQVEVFEKYCQPGSMIAVIHNPDLYNQSAEIFLHSELAAVNYSSHFVISGHSSSLFDIEKYLKTEDMQFLTLPVKYGFHSTNIDPAEEEYKKFLRNFSFSFRKPEIPIISCSLSSWVTDISPEYFWNVVRQPIQFQKTIGKLEATRQFNYIDLGPSGTLASFVRNNLLDKGSASQIYDVLTPFDQEIKKLDKLNELKFKIK